jgi:uncharacterized protein
MRARWLLIAGFLAVGWQAQAAVVDEAGLLNAQQIQNLNQLTANGKVAIHIGTSTQGHSLKAYSDDWALSYKAADPSLGVVITVIPNSHQLFISVGHEARPYFSSADAGQVINGILVPAFRSGNWEGGLTQAVQSIDAHLGSAVSATTLQNTAPAPQAPASDSGLIWIAVLVLAVAAIVAGVSWSRWNRKFRHFEAVVSAGIPDFPMNPEVKAEPPVRDALDMLQDLHSALPIDHAKRTAYYSRRKDDFNMAYETCLRAQQSYELQQSQAAAAQQRFESIRDRYATLPPDQQARFQALETQYAASGYNSLFLLQNMVMMDVMVNALEPHMLYSQPTIIENNYYEDDRQGGGGWQTGSDDFDKDSGGGWGGGDGGGDSGDGGSW